MNLWRRIKPLRNKLKYPVQSAAARLAVSGLDRRPRTLADLDTLNPRAIVVSRNDRIGDLLVGTPVLDTLHRRWPDARIVVIPGPRNRAVLQGLPWTEEGPAIARDPGSWVRVRSWLRRQQFDLAVSLRSESMAGVYISAWSQAPVRITVHGNKTRPAHNLILGVDEYHQLTRYATAARLLGASEMATRPVFVVPPAAEATVAVEFAALGVRDGTPLIGIQIPNRSDSAHSKRALTTRTVVELSRALIADGHQVMLNGLGSEREEALRVQAEAPGALVCPPAPFATFAAQLRRFTVFVSGYTGSLHLADAVGGATVAFGIPRIHNSWFLLGDHHRSIVTDDVPGISSAALLEQTRSLLAAGKGRAGRTA